MSGIIHPLRSPIPNIGLPNAEAACYRFIALILCNENGVVFLIASGVRQLPINRPREL